MVHQRSLPSTTRDTVVVRTRRVGCVPTARLVRCLSFILVNLPIVFDFAVLLHYYFYTSITLLSHMNKPPISLTLARQCLHHLVPPRIIGRPVHVKPTITTTGASGVQRQPPTLKHPLAGNTRDTSTRSLHHIIVDCIVAHVREDVPCC